MGTPLYPSLYQINTRVWLGELSRKTGRPVTLDDIPDEALDRIAGLGFDWVWLLGVWQTGEAARRISLTQPEWRWEYKRILPGYTEADVCGSPFAVQGYTVHVNLGGDRALAALRQRLRDRGVRLMLDFVPNHTAPDHPWVRSHPEFYVAATEADLARDPYSYCRLDGLNGRLVLAHGRDPYFPAWPDVLQLNYRHGGLRQAMIEELGRVAGLCDGVRCDMAMLLLPEVFLRTWGEASRPSDGTAAVDTPFWPEAIARVHEQHPSLVFMAEVYWDLERTLQQQGFDYTYDKRLYDRLRARDAGAVRGHLQADGEFQRKSVRFLENHDEPCAAQEFPWPVHQAAAAVTFLVPGLRFIQEGQCDGRHVRVSMHLNRRPDEPVDPAVQGFYARLLECVRRPEVRDGRWQLLGCRPAWDGNPTWQQFIAFSWQGSNGRRLLVTVNYGPSRGQCYVGLPGADLKGKEFVLRDLLSTARYERSGDGLASQGLYLDMPEWGYHVFDW